MRVVELSKVAAAAEALRLRRLAHRQMMRGIFGAVAALFALALLVVLHVILYQLVRGPLSPVQSSLVVLVFDAAVAGICGYLAMRNTPDSIEQEAKTIRQRALVEMRQSVGMMTLAAEVGGIVLRRKAGIGTPRSGWGQVAGDVVSRLLRRY